MDIILILHLFATWALFGLIWIVQLDLYPLFERVGKAEFVGYHAAHMKRIALIVAPLMLVELASAVWLLLVAGERGVLFVASVVFLVLNWISTGLVQVPLHRKLEREGFDVATCRKLTHSNWIRTVAWSARALLVAFWVG